MADVKTKDIKTIGYVVHQAKEDFKLEDIVLADMQDDELLVDMKFSGICHTDLVFQQGELKICPFPAVFGHEGAGTIRAIGPAVRDKSLKVGDFVLLSINFCEKCKHCRARHPADCMEGTRLHLHGTRPDGTTAARLKNGDQSVRSHFFGQSSFLRTSLVQETCVVKFDGEPEEAAKFAAMGCGYQTGAGTILNILKPRPASSVVIFGLGTVGLTALMAAKYLGVQQIIAVDIQPSKFAIAKELGAHETINSRDILDLAALLKQLTGGGGADYCIDCTGVPAVIETMLNSLAMLGTAVQVGVPPADAKIPISPLKFLLESKRYIGCREGDSVPKEFIPRLVQLQKQGHFPVEKLVRVYGYKEMGKALEDMHHGNAIKPVIQWS